MYSAGFEIRLYRPLSGEPERRHLEIPAHDLLKALEPLPRDRELSFCHDAQQRAREMQAQREWMASKVADRFAALLAPMLLEMMEAQDPHNGYTPEQLMELGDVPQAVPEPPYCPRCGKPV